MYLLIPVDIVAMAWMSNYMAYKTTDAITPPGQNIS